MDVVTLQRNAHQTDVHFRQVIIACSLFIMLFRFLLPDKLVTFSVPVSPRLGAELGGARTIEMFAARGLAGDAMLGNATGGAVLNVGGGAGLFA